MRTRTMLAGLALATALAATACGGSSSAAHNSGTKGKAANAPSGAVDPNAPEVVAPGDIPDTQAFVPYSAPSYTVDVPEGWSQSISGATATFTDHYNTVVITSAATADAPTVTSVRQSQVPALQRTTPDFSLGSVSPVTRAAGAGVVVTYRAGSAPDPVTGKRVALDVERYEFWHNGQQVTLTLSGAHGSDNVDPWKRITDSLAWSA